MRTKITFEEACNIPRNYQNIDVKTNQLFIDANNDPTCSIYTESNGASLFIFVEDKTIANSIVGFEIHTYRTEISVYLTKMYRDEITDAEHVCDVELNTPLADIIKAAKTAIGKCPVCGKAVPYTEQHRFGFAGRCCEDCLPEMKRQHEYPGWYN